MCKIPTLNELVSELFSMCQLTRFFSSTKFPFNHILMSDLT